MYRIILFELLFNRQKPLYKGKKGLTGQESHPQMMGKEKPALSMGDSFAQNQTTTR